MGMETEVKIRITPEELDPIRSHLEKLGALCLAPSQKEENWLFDFSNGALRDAGCIIRVRVYGKEAFLTFKGPVQDNSHFKKREEIESNVGNPEEIKKILHRLGMNVCFKYSKYREIYQLPINQTYVTVCLDETPVGIFVEVEGTKLQIEEVTTRFGWSPDSFVCKSYIEMYKEADQLINAE